MTFSRTKLAVMLSFVMLLVLAGAAFAGSKKSGLVDLDDASIPWALTGGTDESLYQCPHIPEGIVVSTDYGDRLRKANVKDLPQNGGRRITIDDTVSGSATDQNGGSYTFLYKNQATYNYDGDGTVSVQMIDTFHLKGEDTNYTVNFNWRWMYDAPDGIELEEIEDGSTVVNLEVSPGSFPTDDGFTESPSIIAGSWWQVHTNGFIFGCDPI